MWLYGYSFLNDIDSTHSGNWAVWRLYFHRPKPVCVRLVRRYESK